MVESKQLIKLYGDPSVNTLDWERSNMVLWKLPALIHLAIPAIPSKIYIHHKFMPVVECWLTDLIKEGVSSEIRTYDGCWNVRTKRGLKSLSIHAFGMAVDLNASHNPLGLTREQCTAKGLNPFSKKFIDVSRKHLDCGADWVSRPDLMHFQIKKEAAF